MLALIPGLLSALGPLFERLFPDPAERERALADAQGQLLAAAAASDAGQAATNTAEATHPSLFVAGWRPAFGWLCVVCISYALIFRGVIMGVARVWSPEFFLPEVPTEGLFTAMLGMLGLGGFRTLEKLSGVSTAAIGPPTREQVEAARPRVIVPAAPLDDLTSRALNRYERGGQ